MKKLFYLLFFIISLSSCTSTLTLPVLQPSEVSIPPNISRIGLINRSFPDKSETFLNVLEGVLTGESIGGDKEGGDQALIGLREGLSETNRYEIVIPPIGSNQLPRNRDGFLNSEVIHQLCRQYNVQALVVLERFDTDSRIDVQQVVENETINGQVVPVTYFKSRAELAAKTTWRFYDDASNSLLDEYRGVDTKTFVGKGRTALESNNRLPAKRSAINSAGLLAGRNYSCRIAPYWISVERMYFRKGSDGLKKGAKYVKRGLWKMAIDQWKAEARSADPEIAGKANYNMALASEHDGNLQLAKDYAIIARDTYGIPEAVRYVNILNARIEASEEVQRQMGRRE